MRLKYKQKILVEKILSGRVIKEVEMDSQKIGTIFYRSGDETLKLVVRHLKEGYSRVFRFFGFKIPPLQLILLYTRQELDQLTKEKTPLWLVGYASFLQTIYLFSPAVFEKESLHKREEFKTTLCHELTHLFIRQIHPSFEPRWLEEGLAYFVADQKIKEPLNFHFFPTRTLPFFLIDTERKWQKALPHGAYSFSLLLVDFLIKRFGKEKIIEFLSSLKGPYCQKIFCQKFKEIYQQEIKELTQEFFKIINLREKGGEGNESRVKAGICFSV